MAKKYQLGETVFSNGKEGIVVGFSENKEPIIQYKDMSENKVDKKASKMLFS